ncbi:hypothetical protein EMIHUDRAFT_374171 [Emiliania huxleyi CCMP1516]|uniref:PB1 domain-containing protein n=2 Tax=Emiliania huxleyi TaxID=2903 RepID=A0A0D3IX76_EMIH1|nr:hypothetical protein EMIHUDRAFT_374171 [Emiliania huxleyi CCMP1516]EOD15861.1 hypothetical protein EMIHUDRAFT_374171 [Emiliania huxleyi CCMP1516]|eukprot:XP_005768290.1 hypothetical protein EMIHUDRAFT_374171 [Emiliania huxleyi CCMP1516]
MSVYLLANGSMPQPQPQPGFDAGGSITIKMTGPGAIKRWRSSTLITFAHLHQQASQKFSVACFSLRYDDDEGDDVEISTVWNSPWLYILRRLVS